MLKSIYRSIKKYSTIKGIIIMAFFFIASFILINGKPFGISKLKENTGGLGTLDMMICFSPDTIYKHIGGLGIKGRQFYTSNIIPLDFIFPLTYTLFLTILICYLLKMWTGRRALLDLFILIPSITGIADYIENILILIMLHSFPARSNSLILITNTITAIKWVLFMICISVIIYSIACISRIKSKKLHEVSNTNGRN